MAYVPSRGDYVFCNAASIAAVWMKGIPRLAAIDGRLASRIRTSPIICAEQINNGRLRLSPCNILREQTLP